MNKKLKHYVFIYLTISIVISPALTHSAEDNIIESTPSSSSSTNKHKIPNANKNTLPSTDSHDRKATLNDDSRGLSGFFILGIIINIIMFITFSWWFSKEWRRQPK